MIELKGSEKQIKWANDIREKLNEAVNSLLEELDKKRIQEELEDEEGEAWFTTYEEIEDVKTYKIEIIEKETSASWYIHNLKGICDMEIEDVKHTIFRDASRDMNNIFNH